MYGQICTRPLPMQKVLVLMLALLLNATCILAVSETVCAGSPLEDLKSTVDQITRILDDKALRDSMSREALLEKLKEVSQQRFDWEEIAERSLGLYWKDRSAEEKSEFTGLLKNLLLESYLTKIIDNYSGESIHFDKEIREGSRAQVETRIVNKAEKSVSVGARMLIEGDQWLVYDLIIEGVSSLKNYRAQFYDIIRQSSYQDLIKRLKDKQKT